MCLTAHCRRKPIVFSHAGQDGYFLRSVFFRNRSHGQSEEIGIPTSTLHCGGNQIMPIGTLVGVWAQKFADDSL
jgi:hypothetical protein